MISNANTHKILNELHSAILKSLREDNNVKNCVTNIYDYLPKNPSIPYISVHIANYQEISLIPKSALKVKLIFGVYSFHMQNLFEIMESIGMAVSAPNLEHLGYKIVALNNGTINQHDDILYALVSLNVLLKGKYNDKFRI